MCAHPEVVEKPACAPICMCAHLYVRECAPIHKCAHTHVCESAPIRRWESAPIQDLHVRPSVG